MMNYTKIGDKQVIQAFVSIMADWLGLRENDLFFPLLPDDGRPADPAADDPPSDRPQDSHVAASAAAVRALARASSSARDAGAGTRDSAKERRRRLERIQGRMCRVSRRLTDAAVVSDGVARRLERLGPARDVEAAADGEARGMEEEGGDGEDENGAARGDAIGLVASNAFVAVILATAGVATYLATLWQYLSTVMQCFVVTTYVWLFCITITLSVECYLKNRECSEQVQANDSSSVQNQSPSEEAEQHRLLQISLTHHIE